MIVSKNTRQAYSEINEFLGLLSFEQRNKVPQELRYLFFKEKDNSYTKNINPNIPIKDQNLKEETLALIALLNLQYWCEDERERKRLREKYSENEFRYQERLRQKYNPDDLFKKKIINTPKNENAIKEKVALVEYKEKNFIQKLFEKIKHLFKID